MVRLLMVWIWRNLANATEPSVCGGDTALCQITLITLYFYEVDADWLLL